MRTWWLEDGWADVHADEVGNLWARVRPGEGRAAATITGWERGAWEGDGA